MKTRVLIVDDSELVCSLLSQELGRDPDIHVIGTASNSYVARDMIVEFKPDVVTMDIEMPKMNGVEFLERLMKYFPMPVIMVSAHTPEGGDLAMKCLQLGAFDVLLKPSGGESLAEFTANLAEQIKAAKAANVARLAERVSQLAGVVAPPVVKGLGRRVNLIAIGASTGGTEALSRIFKELPEKLPCILVTQHMPKDFTWRFAERLKRESKLDVREGYQGAPLEHGKAYVAPGGQHMTVQPAGGRLHVDCRPGDKVNGHCPSVEVLFNSVAEHVGDKAVGVILTGMGRDGAEGLLNMRRKGARTLGQNKETCVVYGMPMAANEVGAVERELPVGEMAGELVHMVMAG